MSINKNPFSFIALFSISIASAWRLLHILQQTFSNDLFWWLTWGGITLGCVLFLLVTFSALEKLYRRSVRPQRFAIVLGALLFGLGALLLLTPAGLSTISLELSADRVWKPDIFAAGWTTDGSGRIRLDLPVTPPTPVTLEIIATGTRNPKALNSEVRLTDILWADGPPFKFKVLERDQGWIEEKVDWGNIRNRPTLVSKENQPNGLRWQGDVDRPITLIFAKNPNGGEVLLRWNGVVSRTLDLFDPFVRFESTTFSPTHQDELIWRADLPLNVLGQEISLATQVDPVGGSIAQLNRIRLRGWPGAPPEVRGHALTQALHVEDGWFELVPDGVKLKANTNNLAPKLILTGALMTDSFWGIGLPFLENSLIILYLSVGGALLFGLVGQASSLNFLTNLNILVTTLVITVILIEILLGFNLPANDQYYVWEPNLHFVFNPRTDLIPGVSGEANVVINSQGLRGDEFAPTGQDYKILTVGGSTTEALYLDQAEAWPQRLQTRLNVEQHHASVWVGNAGRSGRNTREHVLQVKHLLPQHLELDTLILLLGINDFGLRLEQADSYNPSYAATPGATQRLMRRAFDAFPNQTASIQPYYQHSALWKFSAQFRQTNEQVPTTEPIYVQDDDGTFLIARRHLRQNSEIRSDLPDLSPALAEYERNINQIIDLAKHHKVRVILLTQPAIWRPDLTLQEKRLLWFGWGPNFDYFYSVEALITGMSAYNNKLLDICRNRQVECLDLANILPKDTTVFYDDVHFNESGAAQVSETIAEYLLTQPPFR